MKPERGRAFHAGDRHQELEPWGWGGGERGAGVWGCCMRHGGGLGSPSPPSHSTVLRPVPWQGQLACPRLSPSFRPAARPWDPSGVTAVSWGSASPNGDPASPQAGCHRAGLSCPSLTPPGCGTTGGEVTSAGGTHAAVGGRATPLPPAPRQRGSARGFPHPVPVPPPGCCPPAAASPCCSRELGPGGAAAAALRHAAALPSEVVSLRVVAWQRRRSAAPRCGDAPGSSASPGEMRSGVIYGEMTQLRAGWRQRGAAAAGGEGGARSPRFFLPASLALGLPPCASFPCLDFWGAGAALGVSTAPPVLWQTLCPQPGSAGMGLSLTGGLPHTYRTGQGAVGPACGAHVGALHGGHPHHPLLQHPLSRRAAVLGAG